MNKKSPFIIFLICFSFIFLANYSLKAPFFNGNAIPSRNGSNFVSALRVFPTKGVNISPVNQTQEGYDDFMIKAKQAGDIVTLATQWEDILNLSSSIYEFMNISSDEGFTPLIIVHTNRTLNQTLWDYTVSFIKNYTPEYFGIGNEINGKSFYNESDPELFDNFTSFFNGLCYNVSIEVPNTKIFTIFQLEWMKGLHGGLFGYENNLSNNQWALLNNVTNATAIAFTTYPCLIYNDSADIPVDYYADIRNKISESTLPDTIPVIFTEIGWFWEAPGGWNASSKIEQANFIYRFFDLISGLNPVITIWPFLYDQAVQIPFDKMGLLSSGETTSPAWEAWLSIGKSTIPTELLLFLGLQQTSPSLLSNPIVLYGVLSGIAVVVILIIIAKRRK